MVASGGKVKKCVLLPASSIILVFLAFFIFVSDHQQFNGCLAATNPTNPL